MRLELLPDKVISTLSNQSKAMLTPSQPPQIYCIRWFDDGKIIFVNGIITKHRIEKKDDKQSMFFEEITVHCALPFKPDLPAGKIEKSMTMEQILQIIANSFGVAVTCHPDNKPVKIYHGAWDCDMVKFQVDKTDHYQVSGLFNKDKGICHYVWVFSFNEYRKWFLKN